MQIETCFIRSLRRFCRALWIAVPIAILSGLGVYLWFDGAWLLTAPKSAGTLISGRFSLVDHNGRAVTDGNYKGSWRLIFFGYTRCPDVSPTMLNAVAKIVDKLGSDAKRVIPLFVSIDPERDKSAILKKYVLAFHPRVIGLTGSAAQIEDAAKAFRVHYWKTRAVDDAANYQLDHSEAMFLMDTQGKLATVFSHSTDIEKIVTEIRQRL